MSGRGIINEALLQEGSFLCDTGGGVPNKALLQEGLFLCDIGGGVYPTRHCCRKDFSCVILGGDI